MTNAQGERALHVLRIRAKKIDNENKILHLLWSGYDLIKSHQPFNHHTHRLYFAAFYLIPINFEPDQEGYYYYVKIRKEELSISQLFKKATIQTFDFSE